jgi:peroxiredoxin
MRVLPPTPAQNFESKDIYGAPVSLKEMNGRKVMLCFFRDAACPFCNFRLYELTHSYRDWQAKGVEVVAVFSSTAQEVQQFVAKHPRPFRLIADPDLMIYNQYGVEKSVSAIWKALLFRLPTILRGIRKGGRPKPNPNVTLVPADFLIDEAGNIVDCWYGKNTSDHIPMERLEEFIAK